MIFTNDTNELMKSFQSNLKIIRSNEYKKFFDFLNNLELIEFDIDYLFENNINKLQKNRYVSDKTLSFINSLKTKKSYKINIGDYIFHIYIYLKYDININKFLYYLCKYLQLLISLIVRVTCARCPAKPKAN